MSAPAIRLIVGLGNPGQNYEQTRHNAGAWFVETIAERYDLLLREEVKFQGFTAQLSDLSMRLLMPLTYMNESGRAVSAMAKYYKISPAEILVAHDELDFEPEKSRLKQGGGHGGHNGLRDITKALGSADFWRLRLGIGHPGHKDMVSDYVLSRPGAAHRTLIQQNIDDAIGILPDLAKGEFNKAMNWLHHED